MREAGQRVQPKLSSYTVSSIVRTFRNENRIERRPHSGGRQRLLTNAQEQAIVNMVMANNVIRLREIQSRVVEDQQTFFGVNHISICTIDRILHRNKVNKQQEHKVPFGRNSEQIKIQRMQYVQRIFELDASCIAHEYIFVDEAGFNFTKRRRRHGNIIGQRAIVEVPGQRGGNVTMCAAISQHGLLHSHATLGPHSTTHLLDFLDRLHRHVLQLEPNDDGKSASSNYVVIWENVAFHRAEAISDWFGAHPRFSNVFLPACSPFLNPLEEFFSAWRWKVNDRNPYDGGNLLMAMEEACGDISLVSIQAWLRNSQACFSRCLQRENILCDVDEALWPDPAQRHEADTCQILL